MTSIMTSTVLSMILLTGLIGAVLSTPATIYAQESAAGQEMHESAIAAKDALNAAGQSLKHVYRATRYEVSDAALTTKVKAALLEDSATRKFAIHVSSSQGTVTISGAVDSPATAADAQSVAAAVNGVRSVNNHLTWRTSAR